MGVEWATFHKICKVLRLTWACGGSRYKLHCAVHQYDADRVGGDQPWSPTAALPPPAPHFIPNHYLSTGSLSVFLSFRPSWVGLVPAVGERNFVERCLVCGSARRGGSDCKYPRAPRRPPLHSKATDATRLRRGRRGPAAAVRCATGTSPKWHRHSRRAAAAGRAATGRPSGWAGGLLAPSSHEAHPVRYW